MRPVGSKLSRQGARLPTYKDTSWLLRPSLWLVHHRLLLLLLWLRLLLWLLLLRLLQWVGFVECFQLLLYGLRQGFLHFCHLSLHLLQQFL